MKKNILNNTNDDITQYTFIEHDMHQWIDTSALESDTTAFEALPIGSIFLDKYIITEVLGRGNFAIIYRVKAIELEKSLVIKEFFPKHLVVRDKNNHITLKKSLTIQGKKNYQLMHDTFIGEAKNLVKVTEKSHPNIVTIFALEENVNNTSYFLMNHEAGISLKAYLTKMKKEHGRSLNNAEIYDIAIPLLSGLEQMHSVDVYHQDIKLENILIREDGSPLLLDFGASTILYDIEARRYFNAMTPRYAAIEQINLDIPPKINQKTDIYAMGVLLYKLITDTFPPKIKERLMRINKGEKDPYIPLDSTKITAFDRHLLRAVDKALRISQDERFSSARAFIEAIDKRDKKKKYLLFGLGILAFTVYAWLPKGTGKLMLSPVGEQISIKVDGKEKSLELDDSLKLEVGEHLIEISQPTYVPKIEKIMIAKDQTKKLKLNLMPAEHFVKIKTKTPNLLLSINGKISESSQQFLATYAHKIYEIKVSAKYHQSKTIERSYVALFANHFELNIDLIRNEVKVNIDIKTPKPIGNTIMDVSANEGDVFVDRIANTFVATKGKRYNIHLSNPYYNEIKVIKEYDELAKNPNLHYTFERAYINYKLSTTPNHTKVMFYEKIAGVYVPIFDTAQRIDGVSTFHLPASEEIRMRIYKKGYQEKKIRAFKLLPNLKFKTQKVILAPK